MKKQIFNKKAKQLVISMTLAIVSPFTSIAQETQQVEQSEQTEQVKQAKQINKQALFATTELMAKLSSINYFTADFQQQVFDNENNLIQSGKGNISVSKPNKVNWHTTEPEESLIIANGENLWLYDPFIEQVSIYSYQASVANTPILLLTNESQELWSKYQIEKLSDQRFQIAATDEQSQIKILVIEFQNQKISQFEMTDATGQLSKIVLSNVNDTKTPTPSLFDFVVPEGVQIDDQR